MDDHSGESMKTVANKNLGGSVEKCVDDHNGEPMKKSANKNLGCSMDKFVDDQSGESMKTVAEKTQVALSVDDHSGEAD